MSVDDFEKAVSQVSKVSLFVHSIKSGVLVQIGSKLLQAGAPLCCTSTPTSLQPALCARLVAPDLLLLLRLCFFCLDSLHCCLVRASGLADE